MIYNVGKGGGGASAVNMIIRVTVSASKVGKYITCTKGSTVLTDVVPASMVVEFEVTEFGDWVIACDGLSKTVNTYYYGLYLVEFSHEIVALVPVMTSDTTPYGRVITGVATVQTGSAYKVFTPNNTEYVSFANPIGSEKIGYIFDNPITLKQIKSKLGVNTSGSGTVSAKFQYTIDGINWVNIENSTISISGSKTTKQENTINCDISNVKGVAIIDVSSNPYGVTFWELQFYGYDD